MSNTTSSKLLLSIFLFSLLSCKNVVSPLVGTWEMPSAKNEDRKEDTIKFKSDNRFEGTAFIFSHAHSISGAAAELTDHLIGKWSYNANQKDLLLQYEDIYKVDLKIIVINNDQLVFRVNSVNGKYGLIAGVDDTSQVYTFYRRQQL